MKKPKFEIGQIVGFKGRGLGFARVTSITPQRGVSPVGKYLYHTILLDGLTIIACSEDHLEKLSPEDEDLVRTLDSVGNI